MVDYTYVVNADTYVPCVGSIILLPSRTKNFALHQM